MGRDERCRAPCAKSRPPVPVRPKRLRGLHPILRRDTKRSLVLPTPEDFPHLGAYAYGCYFHKGRGSLVMDGDDLSYICADQVLRTTTCTRGRWALWDHIESYDPVRQFVFFERRDEWRWTLQVWDYCMTTTPQTWWGMRCKGWMDQRLRRDAEKGAKSELYIFQYKKKAA